MTREASIRQTHGAVTLEALEALANKGLLRRAQKDVERGEAGAFRMDEQGLTVTVSGQRVTLVEEGPAKAVCTCPSPGVCQHILAACLKLAQEPAPAPTGNAHEEWIAFRQDELIGVYGLSTLRAAHALSLAHAAQIERGVVLTVRFGTLNAEVVALPGAGLAGIIVNGASEKRHPLLAAAALLAVRREAGVDWEPPASTSQPSAPAHRNEVLQAASALLEEAVASGLARLSPALAERFDALAISAETAELHRLSLLLQRIATLTDDWLKRRPHADLSGILGEMAMAYALVHAGPHLAAGMARETYAEAGSVDLMGVAAWPWRTPSGYEGLTLLLWDQANSAWNTWSDARPRAFQGGFSAVARYGQPGPWEGAESPSQVAHSRFRLLHAKRNRWGRLSSSAQSKALVTGAADLTSLPFCDDWGALDLAPVLGLRERDPRSAYQILCPAAWERHAFDPIDQALSWMLIDKQGRSLEMRLPFDELARPAIERLEKLPDVDLNGSRLIGRCLRLQGRTQCQPLALIQGGRSVPLYFAEAKPAPAVAGLLAMANEDEIDESEPEIRTETSAAASQLSLAAISALEWLAESGVAAPRSQPIERMHELSRQAGQLGLARLERLLEAPPSAAHLLRLRWLLAVMLRAAEA